MTTYDPHVHLLITGPQGSGKTALARSLAEHHTRGGAYARVGINELEFGGLGILANNLGTLIVEVDERVAAKSSAVLAALINSTEVDIFPERAPALTVTVPRIIVCTGDRDALPPSVRRLITITLAAPDHQTQASSDHGADTTTVA